MINQPHLPDPALNGLPLSENIFHIHFIQIGNDFVHTLHQQFFLFILIKIYIGFTHFSSSLAFSFRHFNHSYFLKIPSGLPNSARQLLAPPHLDLLHQHIHQMGQRLIDQSHNIQIVTMDGQQYFAGFAGDNPFGHFRR